MQINCLKLEERRRVGGTRTQSSCLELEEEQRRVEGTRMQRIFLEEEERRRVERTTLLLSSYSKKLLCILVLTKLVRLQRSGIDTIKYHT